jgi:uncharacterized protein YlaI
METTVQSSIQIHVILVKTESFINKSGDNIISDCMKTTKISARSKIGATRKGGRTSTGERANQIKCSNCGEVKGVRPDVLEKRMEKAGVNTKEALEKTYLCLNCRPKAKKKSESKVPKSGKISVRSRTRTRSSNPIKVVNDDENESDPEELESENEDSNA